MAFKLHDQALGRAREHLRAALGAAAAKREENRDTPNTISYAGGAPEKVESPEFHRVGMYAPFGEDVKNNPGYFDEWIGRHLAGPGMNPGPQSPPIA